MTGSHKNPVYLVKFTQYNVTEQLYPKDIKPAGNASKKRKLDTPATPTGGATPNGGTVISQPAAINAELAEARRDQLGADATQKPAKKGRKLEQKKVLEAGQKKWQDFAAKGVKGKVGKSKKIGEASMFRTPDSVHGRGMSASRLTPLSCIQNEVCADVCGVQSDSQVLASPCGKMSPEGSTSISKRTMKSNEFNISSERYTMSVR